MEAGNHGQAGASPCQARANSSRDLIDAPFAQILIGVQELLDAPNAEDPAQLEAYTTFKKDKQAYECVALSTPQLAQPLTWSPRTAGSASRARQRSTSPSRHRIAVVSSASSLSSFLPSWCAACPRSACLSTIPRAVVHSPFVPFEQALREKRRTG